MEDRTNTLSKIYENAVMIEVDTFIVPNSLASTADLCTPFQNDEVTRLVKFNNDNGRNFNVVTGKCVQLWYTGENTCGSENLEDHGFKLLDENGEECYMNLGFRSGYIPVGIFDGKKEGDIVDIVVPAYRWNDDNQQHEVKVTLRCTLRQSKYRYRNFGTFETCLARLAG